MTGPRDNGDNEDGRGDVPAPKGRETGSRRISKRGPIRLGGMGQTTTVEEAAAVPVARESQEHVSAEAADAPAPPAPVAAERHVDVSRVLAYGVLPGLALVLALAAGFLKWQYSSIQEDDISRHESVQVAKDCTVALMSFRPDTVEQDLSSARDRLTGRFRDTYTRVTRDVLAPYAKENHVSSVAHVEAAAPVSASENHAVVLVFADQAVTVGDSQSTEARSSVRVTLDKIAGRWLVSGFYPL